MITIRDNELSDRSVWHVCKVPTMLGVPLLVKRDGPSFQNRDREIAVFMMVDPVTGKEKKVKEVITYIDENTQKMEMFDIDTNGKGFKNMEILSKRRK